MIAFMQTASKPDFLQPLSKKRLQTDFAAGFVAEQVLAESLFPRLAPAGVVLSLPLTVSARFDGRDRLVIRIAGEAAIACARCLAPLGRAMDITCRFRLFETEAQADQAVSALDPEEPVCDADGQSLCDLIEDEVLMQMAEPMLHADCSMPEARSEDRQRPFAGLDQLLVQSGVRKKS